MNNTHESKTYYLGIRKQGSKAILQAVESIDMLSNEITDYLGLRQVTKAKLRKQKNRKAILEYLQQDKKYAHCTSLRIEEPKVSYTPLDGKNIVSCRVHYENITVRDDEGYLYYIPENTLLAVLAEFKFHPELKRTRTWLTPIFPPVMEESLVEEPKAPYYKLENVRDKWVCAFDTVCGGWDCVRHHGGEMDGMPFLYDSKEAVENDEFFDKENDFAFKADMFVEGRKVILTDKGMKIQGEYIAREPQADYPQPVPVVELNKGWTSEDSWEFDFSKILIRMSKDTRISLLRATNPLKQEKWMWAIEILCNDEVSYLDENGQEINENWRPSNEHFFLTRYGIYFCAEHKHNSQCRLKSEEFNINDTFDIYTDNNKSAEKILLPSK